MPRLNRSRPAARCNAATDPGTAARIVDAAPDSGLELVETKFKTTPMAETEQPAAAGPRRVRPPKVAVVEEPLQIVETQRTQLPPTS
jgi:hypothetical protein